MQIPACTPDPIHVLSSTPNGVPIQAITPARSELETMAGTSRSRRRTLSYLEESQASSKDEETKLSDELPFPNKFSIKVQKAIDADKVLSVRRELIAELASFYSTLSKYPHQGDYKRMALKVCDQFPDLRDSNPSHYWVCFSNICHFQLRMSTGPRRVTLLHVPEENKVLLVFSNPKH